MGKGANFIVCWVLSFLFYQLQNWGSENLSNLFKAVWSIITGLVWDQLTLGSRVFYWTMSLCSQETRNKVFRAEMLRDIEGNLSLTVLLFVNFLPLLLACFSCKFLSWEPELSSLPIKSSLAPSVSGTSLWSMIVATVPRSCCLIGCLLPVEGLKTEDLACFSHYHLSTWFGKLINIGWINEWTESEK